MWNDFIIFITANIGFLGALLGGFLGAKFVLWLKDKRDCKEFCDGFDRGTKLGEQAGAAMERVKMAQQISTLKLVVEQLLKELERKGKK